MRCDYQDDFRVDYSGSLHITKGSGVDLTVKGSQIPSTIKTRLDAAVGNKSCHELRAAARAFTGTIHEAFGKE